MPSPVLERINKMSKIRVIVDIDINNESCTEFDIVEDVLVINAKKSCFGIKH